MATFNLIGASTVARTLINSETGIVGSNASIQVTSGAAVTMSDGSGLLVAGDILASSGAAIRASSADRLNITIAEGANVVSGGTGSSAFTTMFLPVGDFLRITSAGNIQSAFRGIDASSNDDFTRFEINLSGTINSLDDAVSLQTTGLDSSINLAHSGDMLTDEIGVSLQGVSTTNMDFNNSGLIQSDSTGVAVTNANSVDIVNSGTITGSASAIAFTGAIGSSDIDNSGNIIGLVDLSDDNDVLRNSGLIDGDVLLGDSDDVLNSRHGTITGDILAGAGNDLVRGSQNADSIQGDTGDDTIYGYGGDDVLLGSAGFDTIRGGSGDDEIDGGGRSDVLVGGKGNDTLTGGGGNDTFVIRRVGNGDDEVTDFADGSDLIDVSALGIQNFNAFNLAGALSNDNDAVVIDLELMGGSGSLRLVGVQVVDMDASDFIF